MVKNVVNRLNSSGDNTNILDDVLDTLRFRGSIFFTSKLAAPWGMSLNKMQNPRFHISLNGGFFVGVEKDVNDHGSDKHEVIKVNDMDIILLPHGEMHWMADQLGRHLTPSQQAGDACELGMPLFQNGDITNKVICGLIDYDHDTVHPILHSLPRALHFKGIEHDDPIWMTVLLLDAEMSKGKNIQSSIIDRLTEVLFMQLLNKHGEENNDAMGFFSALRDKRIHRALVSIHDNPEYPWTLDLLAKRVNMSRATLSRHFNETVGVPPMTYILNWRLTKACQLIKHSTNTIEQISDMVGFSSARTLTRSFQRQYGLTPSEMRRKTSTGVA